MLKRWEFLNEMHNWDSSKFEWYKNSWETQIKIKEEFNKKCIVKKTNGSF